MGTGVAQTGTRRRCRLLEEVCNDARNRFRACRRRCGGADSITLQKREVQQLRQKFKRMKRLSPAPAVTSYGPTTVFCVLEFLLLP